MKTAHATLTGVLGAINFGMYSLPFSSDNKAVRSSKSDKERTENANEPSGKKNPVKE